LKINTSLKTIIIIVASPLNEDIIKRIGLHAFEKKMNVVIFDCLPWVRKKVISNNYQNLSLNIIVINDYIEFKKNITSLNCHFLIDFIGFDKHTRDIQTCCKSNKILYITQSLHPIPTPILRSNALKSFIYSPKATINKIYSLGKRLIFNQIPINPDISFLVGDLSVNHLNKHSIHRIFTTSQSWYDIENQKKLKTINNLCPQNYILFIDDCLSQSVDFILTNQKSIITPDEYYILLNNFFDKIEFEFNIPIIIAGHPNGKYIENYANYFNNRTLIFDSTASLTLNADLVLTHYSTAINYAILSEKRIILMNFYKLQMSYQGLILQNIAKILNCIIIDIDKPLKLNKEILTYSINKSSYKLFIKNYISNEKIINKLGQFENLINYINKIK
jgi:hypothetical protein